MAGSVADHQHAVERQPQTWRRVESRVIELELEQLAHYVLTDERHHSSPKPTGLAFR
jgi:hypothetical protein